MSDLDDERVPCVCCMMSDQQENGFCLRCNIDGCPNDPYWTNGPDAEPGDQVTELANQPEGDRR